MRADLKQYLVRHVNVANFYSDHLEGYQPGVNAQCPFHSDSTPSLSIRKEDGAFFCHGCGAKGSSLIGFYESLYKLTFAEACSRIYSEYIRPTVALTKVSKWQTSLLASPKVLDFIQEKRGVSRFTMKMLRLGWDGERIAIPIINEFGLCVNVRRYHPKLIPKILSYKKGFGEAALFPLNLFRKDDDDVLLVEGEWDAILAWQMGYNVLTSTSGATSWNPEFSAYLKDSKTVVFYDADKAGDEGSRRVVAALQNAAKSIKVLRVTPGDGQKDISDFVVRGGWTKAHIDKLIAKAEAVPLVVQNQNEASRMHDNTPLKVKLHEASKGELFYRPITTEAHVVGKRLTPYLPIHRMQITCRMDRGKLCQTCHMLAASGKKTFKFKATDRRILGLVEVTDTTAEKTIKSYARIPPGCGIQVETLSTFNMEELTVIPPIDDLGGSYTARRAYYVGHGLPSNRSYIFEGYTVPHPKDQSATHVFTSAENALSHLETYELTPDIIERLKRFQAPAGGITDRIRQIEEFLSRRVTKILQRRNLHAAVDLVFHSPLAFYFNNEKLKKGWLEAAIIGDTRCGKGFVATELVRYYGLGEIATAENCSFAGLIGGLMKMGNTFSITWGVIPRNTDRLVIIDETSGLSTDDLSKMTRVRSEGVAEIFKIQSEATQARTRLIWLSNTRSGRPVNTYSYGVEAVSELFGKAEDVSKLDYALIVQGGDVSAEVINAPRELLKGDDEYAQEDFRNLVMWVWTRGPNQIFFTQKATTFILQSAMEMGRLYHPSIPLVQIEDVRIKIARIAAAVAGRVFSTDATHKNLVVTSECAKFAVSFLREIYDSVPTSYGSYSRTQIKASTVKNASEVLDLIRDLGSHKGNVIEGILNTKCITITDISDFMDCDKFQAKDFIGKLVRHRCLVKEYTYYTKRAPFIDLLRRIR